MVIFRKRKTTFSQLQICNGHRTARITQSFNPTGIVCVDPFYKHMLSLSFFYNSSSANLNNVQSSKQSLKILLFNVKSLSPFGKYMIVVHFVKEHIFAFPTHTMPIFETFVWISPESPVSILQHPKRSYIKILQILVCIRLEISLCPYHQSGLKAWPKVLPCLHYPLNVSNKKPCNLRLGRTFIKIVEASKPTRQRKCCDINVLVIR